MTRHIRTSFTVAVMALLFIAVGAPTRRADLDHVGAYNFMVEISGVNAGYFRSVDGLSFADHKLIEFQDGDDLFLRKRPGRAKFGALTVDVEPFIRTLDDMAEQSERAERQLLEGLAYDLERTSSPRVELRQIFGRCFDDGRCRTSWQLEIEGVTQGAIGLEWVAF